MKKIIHPSNERGHADHGWLNAYHSFSFAGWYDPAKVHFGMLRVLNDDRIAGGEGFGIHPHHDMEIITIVHNGALEHKDSMGNGSVIRAGDVQVMSAGTGVYHSEFNPSSSEETNLFQLWIFPKEKGIKPHYDQKSFSTTDRKNKIQLVASGFRKNGELYIHQDASLSLVDLDKDFSIDYRMSKAGNGAYVMIIEGSVVIAEEQLNRRDAIGVSETDLFTIHSLSDKSRILIVDVPMK